MTTELLLALGAVSSCCCFAFFVLLIAVAVMLYRRQKAVPDAVDGLPPAPASGTQTSASLTFLEDDRDRAASAGDPVPPPAPPAEDEYGSTMVIDRHLQSELAPPPPPPFVSSTASPNRPRLYEPQPTIVADDSGPYPLPPKSTRNG